MKRFMKLGKVSALLSTLLMTCSPFVPASRADGPAAAAANAPQTQPRRPAGKSSIDVVTSAAGEFNGAVVNGKSAPAAKARVRLCLAGGICSQEAVTDAGGRFSFKDVRPGLYTLSVKSGEGQIQQVARVWSNDTAPPAATPVALVALQQDDQPPQDEDVVRGLPTVGAGGLLVGALIVAGVAAAIAVPIAVANSVNSSP